ncbi:MAG: hemerythrin domain-containing protein, partial [Rhodospirillaceae bacterium]
VQALHDYADVHFRREEELQRAIGFPYHDAHKMAHKDLLKDLRLVGGNLLRNYSEKQHGEFSAFLRHWLIDHVQEVDVRMKPYVDDMRKMRSAVRTPARR